MHTAIKDGHEVETRLAYSVSCSPNVQADDMSIIALTCTDTAVCQRHRRPHPTRSQPYQSTSG